ncbi:MAG: response regulator [Anaerolineales bacterium]|nr:response regulator [Anaerolineales bacterium]
MPSAYVVDDHRETAVSLAQWLGWLSYEARVFLGPRSALEALARRLPDVVFLDIHMAGMDGMEVCRYMRRDPRLAPVPIVAISSDAQPALGERARLAGANGFLSKPLELEALEEVLRAVEKLNGAAARPALGGVSLRLAQRPLAG